MSNKRSISCWNENAFLCIRKCISFISNCKTTVNLVSIPIIQEVLSSFVIEIERGIASQKRTRSPQTCNYESMQIESFMALCICNWPAVWITDACSYITSLIWWLYEASERFWVIISWARVWRAVLGSDWASMKYKSYSLRCLMQL